MINITKGDKTVVYAGSMILKDDEPVRLSISLPAGAPIATQMLKVEIIFTNRTAPDTQVTWKAGEDGTVRFELSGWKAPATAMTLPVSFGQYNGEKLWLNLAQHRIDFLSVAHIEILQGGRADAA